MVGSVPKGHSSNSPVSAMWRYFPPKLFFNVCKHLVNSDKYPRRTGYPTNKWHRNDEL